MPPKKRYDVLRMELRLPGDLGARCRAIAAREDRTMNSLVTHVLREWIRRYELGEETVPKEGEE